jgi:hypothetical protein
MRNNTRRNGCLTISLIGAGILMASASVYGFYSAAQIPDLHDRAALTNALDVIERVPGVHENWTRQENAFTGERPKIYSPEYAIKYALMAVQESHLANPAYDSDFSKLEKDILFVKDTFDSMDESGISVNPELIYAPALVNLGNEIDRIADYPHAKGSDNMLGTAGAIGFGAGLLTIPLLYAIPPTSPPGPKKEQTTD